MWISLEFYKIKTLFKEGQIAFRCKNICEQQLFIPWIISCFLTLFLLLHGNFEKMNLTLGVG